MLSARVDSIIVFVTALFLIAPLANAQSPRAITLEQTAGRGDNNIDFRGRIAARWEWADDGVRLHRRADGKDWWLDPATGVITSEAVAANATERESRANTPDAARVAAFRALAGFDDDRASKAARAPRVASHEARSVVQFEGDLYLLTKTQESDSDGSRYAVRRLTADPALEELCSFSPNGEFISYVVAGNLWICDWERAPLQVTVDGTDRVLNGKLDWVYQEEIYGRGNFQAHWWSPDSQHVAFLRLDGTRVPNFPIVDHLPLHQQLETDTYPKAGDPNPIATLGVASLDGSLIWADLARYAGQEILLAAVSWTPRGDHVVLKIQDRIQTWLDLNLVAVESGVLRQLLHETSDTWVNVLAGPYWLTKAETDASPSDERFLWLSERTGYCHLYWCNVANPVLEPITQGEWQVREWLRVDPERRKIWFTATEQSPIERHAYCVNFDGSGFVRLTQGAGRHRITLSADGESFLDEYSSVDVPPQQRLCRALGRDIQVLGAAKPAALEEYGYRRPTLLRIPARDGVLLDALVILPTATTTTASGGRFPVWLQTYSGPDAPTVANEWQSSAFDQFLVQQGVMVFKVNNRTSSGAGQRFTSACYRALGASELRDLEDALAWLTANYPADSTRVGISGWSYGGFMAGYALTHSRAFKLGIAGAGVYDWRNYDSIYTERFMATPELNSVGYQQSSCIAAAERLHGHLVLAHGAMDDNVHLQNTLQFVNELQKHPVSFELMVYPRSRHGLGGQQNWHFRRLTWAAIQRHLLSAPATGTAPG
ncbi:MAG: S9 family peptidase [Planctomycetota bacterium]